MTLRQTRYGSKAFSIYEQNADDLYGSFLSHYKSNQASVIKLLENPSLTLRQSLFLELFSKVYAKYEGTLSSNKECDFDDLLIESARLVNENKYRVVFQKVC